MDQERFRYPQPPKKTPTQKELKAVADKAHKEFLEKDLPKIEKRFPKDDGKTRILRVND